MWPFKKKADPIKLECPTCKQALENYSEKRFKCPHCKNWIYFWDNLLLIKEDRDRLQAECYRQRDQDRIRNSILEKLGLNEDLFKNRENELTKIAGGVKPKEVAVINSLFNERMLKIKNLHEAREWYYNLARYFVEKNEDPFLTLKCAMLTQLAELKQEKYSSVSIIATGNCDACRDLDGQVFTIAEAKKKMPLPIRECSNKSERDSFPICTCLYTGEADETYLNRVCK